MSLAGSIVRQMRIREAARSQVESLERRVLLTTTWTVTSTADDGSAGTLRSIIANSSPGDTIQFDPAVFAPTSPQTITLNGTALNIDHDLTIDGPGSQVLTISAAGTSQVFTEPAGGQTVAISNLTIAHGRLTNNLSGGGIENESTLSLTGDTVTNCSANNGGGIGNTGTITISNCSFSGSSAFDGSSFYNTGHAVVTDSVFTSGTGDSGSEAVSGAGGTISLSGCTFSNNNEGALVGFGMTVNNSTFTNNYFSGSTSIGGSDLDGAGDVLSGCTFSNQSGTHAAAAIDDGGLITIDHSTFSSFSQSAIFFANSASLTVTDSVFAKNSNMGAINCFGHDAEINIAGCTFSNNFSFHATSGGAISCDGSLNIVNSTFFGNSSGTSSSLAGAGAIEFLGTGGSQNSITNSTITGNSSYGSSGGLEIDNGSMILNNSIISGNHESGTTTPSDIAGFVSGSNNLIGSGGSGGLTNGVNGNIVGVDDPMLASLGDYGGSTQTMPPLPGSKAIDAGSNALAVDANGVPLPTDQRGLPRITGAAVDIGADEYDPFVVDGSSNNDNVTLSLTADHQHINWTFGGSSGQLLIDDPNGLTINGNGGNDTITLDYTNGNPLPNIMHLNSGTGNFNINGLQGTNPLAGTTLEIGRSTVFISYSSSDPIAAIQGYLHNGYNSGAWNGTPTASTGVITSAAAAANPNHTTGIGYADSADGQGVNTTPNTIELTYTLYGDANLDHQVNSADLQRFLNFFNTSGGGWDEGDFNYDGVNNSADQQIILFDFNTSLGSQATLLAVAATPASTTADNAPTSKGDLSPHLMLVRPVPPPAVSAVRSRPPILSGEGTSSAIRRRVASFLS